LSTVAAFQFRLILEELDGPVAGRAFHLENIARLPKSLVLSGASDHTAIPQ
jgi:hypothetical protein